MSSLRYLANLLVYSNIFIGLCAVAMVAATEIWWNIPLQFDVLDVFVFCGTLSSYTLHRLVAFRNPNSNKRAAVRWSFDRKNLFYVLFVLGVSGTGICFFLLDRKVQLFLLLFGFLTVFYSVPLFFTKNLKKFRDFPGLKIFLIAFVWAGVSVVLPMVANDIPVFNVTGQLFLLERALFIFLITLPFDIRDVALDRKENVATIPNTFGIKKTKWLGYACIVLLLFLNFVNFYHTIFPIALFGIFAVFYGSTAYFIGTSSPNRHEMFCLFWVDGLMLGLFLCHLCLVV